MASSFAAQQPGVDGKPLYYLIEYDVTEAEDHYLYKGRGYVTNDFNKQITESDEAFYYSFERSKADWSVVNKIKIGSRLGEDMAAKIRDTIFKDLVLSGTMGYEKQQGL